MATPFKVFRDNQKILLVIFGVLLMVAFVVMPPLVDSYRPQPADADTGNEVVVVVGDEELTENEVMTITSKFDIVARVMGNAIQRAVALQGTPEPPMPPIPGLQIQPPSQQAPMQPVYNPVPPEVAVRFHAWAKKADELNLVVDDQTVRDFLRETSGGRLSDYDYNALIELMQQDNPNFRLNYDSFFEMVRDVLKAQKVQALFIRDGRVVTPTAAWVAYRNLNRTLSAELFPIRASDYLDKVGQPTEEQVRELFEKYRHQPNDPFQNQIGFRQMDKLALAYVKGDVNAFLEKAKQEITDEQVAQHYEQNKDSYRKPQLPPAESQSAPEEQTEAPADTDAPESSEAEAPMDTPAEMPAESPASEPAAEPMPEAPIPVTPMPEEPASEDTPAEPSATEEAPAAEETPAVEEAPAEPSESEEPVPESPEPEDSSQVAPRDKVRLVSFLQEEEEAAAENGEPSADAPAEPASEEESTEQSPAEPSQEPAETQEPTETPAEPNQPMPETPMTEQPAGEEPATETPATATPATEAPASGDDPMAEEPPVEYRPLEEVADQIRTQLAQPIAQEKLTSALSEVRSALQFQYEEYRYSEAEKQEKSPYDTSEIQQMAEELGLTYSTLPLMDIFTAAQTSLGQEAVQQVFLRDPGPQGFRQDTRQLIVEAFQSNAPLYQPRLFPGPMNSPEILHAFPPEVQYLYWKTETKEGFSPELDDVRDEVVEVWRKQQAAKLAREAAQKLASQIDSAEALNQAAQEKEAEVIVAENVTYFNQFSAMNPQQGLSLGTIPGIEDISQETMEVLFGTPVGEASAVPNRDKSVYYVAFVTEESESAEKMREQFLTMIQGELPMSVQSYASQEENVVTGAILQDFFDPSHIEWKIDPVDLDSQS